MLNSKAITAKHRERWDRLRDYGCAACRRLDMIRSPEMHHILSGGRRMGHDHTIPLCAWHHRGEPYPLDISAKFVEEILGPSMARNKKAFVARFGSEQDLLDKVNEWLANH